MARPSERPNILFLHTDQQRYDTLACAGNSLMHTPNLDRLAENGAVFESFYVQNPVCMPSRASMLSGRYPTDTGVTCNGIPMPENTRCLQHMLGDAGYFTGIIGKLHFLPHSARDHRLAHPPYGFDQLQVSDEPGCYRDAYREWVREQDPSQLDAINCGLPPARAQWERMMGWEGTVKPPEPREGLEPKVFEGNESLTQAAFVADRSMQFLEEQGNRPFFLFAGFYAPHPPLIPPASCVEMYDVEEMPLPARTDEEPLASQAQGLTDDDYRKIKAYYYALVSDVDRNVGKVLQRLEDLGIADNTLVVFTSDHGEYLGDHGKFGKGTPGHDCIMRVPCLISYPGHIQPETRLRGFVEGVDLAPTLLDYAGVVQEPELHGHSVRPMIEGEQQSMRSSVYAEYSMPRRGRWAMLRTQDYMYAMHTQGREVLFDLQNDPGEHHDIAKEPNAATALSEMRELTLRRSLEARPQLPRQAAY